MTTLIFLLQGGPGASSTRHGLFEIIGPLDTDFLPREHSWVRGTVNEQMLKALTRFKLIKNGCI